MSNSFVLYTRGTNYKNDQSRAAGLSTKASQVSQSRSVTRFARCGAFEKTYLRGFESLRENPRKAITPLSASPLSFT